MTDLLLAFAPEELMMKRAREMLTPALSRHKQEGWLSVEGLRLK